MEQFVFMLGSKESGAFSDQCKPEIIFIKTKTTHNFPRIFFESVKLESDFFSVFEFSTRLFLSNLSKRHANKFYKIFILRGMKFSSKQNIAERLRPSLLLICSSFRAAVSVTNGGALSWNAVIHFWVDQIKMNTQTFFCPEMKLHLKIRLLVMCLFHTSRWCLHDAHVNFVLIQQLLWNSSSLCSALKLCVTVQVVSACIATCKKWILANEAIIRVRCSNLNLGIESCGNKYAQTLRFSYLTKIKISNKRFLGFSLIS